MTITLAGGASTQSRARRPLPPGAVSARTLDVTGAEETVLLEFPDGSSYESGFLSWVGGQSGLLWGSADGLPFDIDRQGAHDAAGSYGHANEWDLADALGIALDGVFPTADLSCRFFQDGGTALAAAARVARHATGRKFITSYGYHGAAEEWSHGPNDAGLLKPAIEHHMRFDWGERPLYEASLCAAICVEVPPVPDDEARDYLQYIRRVCDESGAIFILDEVVTGFRFGLQGAAGRYGVKPDIACYGKAMSATGCVSAIVGRRDLVDLLAEPVFYSTTFGGAPGPCAVAAATVRWLTEHPEAFEHLSNIGRALQDGFNAMGLNCIGQPERSVLKFANDIEWVGFCSMMIERGVMIHRPQFPSLAHTMADVTLTLEKAAEVLTLKGAKKAQVTA